MPILEFQDNFLGQTDYLDSIQIEDLTDPIMIGKDCFHRPFIVIKYYFEDQTHLLTVFQRYTDDKNTWVKSSHLYGPILKMSNTYLNIFYKNQLIKNICQLFNKDSVTIIKYDLQTEELNCKL